MNETLPTMMVTMMMAMILLKRRPGVVHERRRENVGHHKMTIAAVYQRRCAENHFGRGGQFRTGEELFLPFLRAREYITKFAGTLSAMKPGSAVFP